MLAKPAKPLPDDDVLLTEADVARMFQMHPITLRMWRSNQVADQPPYIKFPGEVSGPVRYSKRALEAWMARRTVDPKARGAQRA
jgi:hypothetical protein